MCRSVFGYGVLTSVVSGIGGGRTVTCGHIQINAGRFANYLYFKIHKIRMIFVMSVKL